MVLKPEVVRERLLHLEEVITRLEELQHLNPRQMRESPRDSWAVERGLQVGAEIVFDIGNHILAAHFGRSAKDIDPDRVFSHLEVAPRRFSEFARDVRVWLEGILVEPDGEVSG